MTQRAVAIVCIVLAAGCGCAQREPFRVSLSVGEATEVLLRLGYVYSDGSGEARSLEDLQRLLIRHGSTEMWARINTRRAHRKNSIRSLAKALDRARIAAKLGIRFNPELGLFGEYGDVRGQMPPDFSEYPEIKLPGPWLTLTVEQMEAAVRTYARIAAKEILATGAEVGIWDIGNEINFGIAGIAPAPAPGFAPAGKKDWYEPPDGINPEIGRKSVYDLVRMPDPQRIAWCRLNVWPYVARILKAAARGIREVAPDARFSTHLAFGTGPEFAVAFYRAMAAAGVELDELGTSFFPSSKPGRLKALKDMVGRLTREFGKPVFIAEYAYNAGRMTGSFSKWNHACPGYPFSEAGQAALLRDLTSWGLAHGLSGIRPYGADFVVPGWRPLALFAVRDGTQRAVARKSIDSIRRGLARPGLAAPTAR